MGEREKALQLAVEVAAAAETRAVSPMTQAIVYVRLGELDKAMDFPGGSLCPQRQFVGIFTRRAYFRPHPRTPPVLQADRKDRFAELMGACGPIT